MTRTVSPRALRWAPFAIVGLLVAGVGPSGCKTAPQPKPKVSKPQPLPAGLLPPEGDAPKLRRAEAAWLGNKHKEALEEIQGVLRTDPDHLEARVLLALAHTRALRMDAAKKAWLRVERIIVVKGKIRPFVLHTTLLGAAEHYVALGRRQRGKLFLEALWRRFPGSDAAAQGQLLVATQAYRDGRWHLVRRACAELARVQPKHRGNQRCRQLVLVARRLQAVGPAAPVKGPRWAWDSSSQANDLFAVWIGPRGTRVAVGAAGTILERGRRDKRWRRVPALTRWRLRALAGAQLEGLFAVGDGGVVLQRRAGRWTVLRSAEPGHADLYGVFAPTATSFVAVGDGGVVVRYGARRFSREHPTKTSLRGVWGQGTKVFAVGDEGTLLRHDGKRWEKLSSDAYENLRGIWGAGLDHILIAGDRRTVIHYDGQRAKESVQGMADLRAVWGVGRKLAFAVGKGGAVLRSGRKPLAEWRSESSGTVAELHALAGRGAKAVWAVGQGGTILQRRGRRWRLEAGGSVETLVSISVPSSEGGVALGLRGKLLTRRKGRALAGGARGGRWRATTLPERGIYRDHWSDGQRLLAVGHRGLIVSGDGKAYHRIQSGTAEDLLAVHRCGQRSYAAGTRGTLLRIEGDRASAERVPTGQRLRGLAGCRVPLVVGDRGVILRRGRAGSWIREESGLLANLYATWTDAKETVAFAVGEGGTVLRRRAGRWSLMATPLAQTLIGVWGRSASDVYAVSAGGNVIHFDGKRWALQRSPAACLMGIEGKGSSVYAVGCNCGVLKLRR